MFYCNAPNANTPAYGLHCHEQVGRTSLSRAPPPPPHAVFRYRALVAAWPTPTTRSRPRRPPMRSQRAWHATLNPTTAHAPEAPRDTTIPAPSARVSVNTKRGASSIITASNGRSPPPPPARLFESFRPALRSAYRCSKHYALLAHRRALTLGIRNTRHATGLDDRDEL
ncbi:hypothetical protein PUNSTDRAFT_54385 [Punctularia strigosozonata HHB-11173 SS5]|uniref:uncharacterized protein n=1 Tax=Punctularia strigosozonata (strain HHB-11173) TaxID=741275 RepID=UPI0004417AC5|nr:uncharacterized protein PUNSTDRAFT_54385 [Punctularia strigosozonata HHB-11173 SS5]EIN06075.1 hypothetical protein PUNSTDRAFT_54385 [Punctularia strigosozonata HHB-11173 SS5]